MKHLLYLGLISMLFLATYGCSQQSGGSKVEQLRAKYDKLMDEGKAGDPETQAVLDELATAFEEEAESQEDEEAKAEFLYRAAEINEVSSRKITKALQLYDRILKEYPGSEKAADALFHKAFLNNQIKNYEVSKEAYELFIEKYPNSDLVDDAQYEIKYMGLTDDELFEIIKKNADSLNSGDSLR